MGLVLVPADAEVDSVIFRLRATDQDADFPLVFEITATITPVVRIDNLPCTLYNKVCQANVILTKRLVPGRLHDFAVRVRDTKGDSNSMQATISVTNATTPRDKIFPHIPSLIMVPEDTKPGKELDYLLVRANSWSGKPVYIELWQPKELFTIRQRQTPTQTRGIITLIGELDFETQSMYTLTMYATDPYTEPGKDTRNIAGLSVVVVVQDVQDVPPIFTLAPPLTRINNSVQPGDIILRVHAEDGDKGVPREIVYGLVSEGNPFTPFFNISETSGEITLARPLEELTQITHVGAPVVLTVVAEEIRRSREEPPAQATVVDVGFLLGEPGNSPPYFESDNYIATIDENPEPGTVINFGEQYSTRVKDEDIGKAGVFALKLENNNGTFEINPTVAERTADFIITVRDNTLIDYELYKIVAQEVGPATNLSASVPVTIFLRDVNDNPPVFEEELYEVTLSENVTVGSRVIQVHATDKDTGAYGSIQYTSIAGEGSEAFTMDPHTGLITVAMGSSLDREIAAKLVLTVEARDENGNGNSGVVPLVVNLLDVNDNAPIFEKDIYEFMLNSDLTNFTSPAYIKATDADAEPPNNIIRYEIVHGNYENKFYLNETSGELILRSPITKIRRKKQSAYDKVSKKAEKEFVGSQGKIQHVDKDESLMNNRNKTNSVNFTKSITTEVITKRRKRANEDPLYTLTARAYDLGVPHLSSVTEIRIISGIVMEARIMMFVVPGEQPDSRKTAETLAAITGGRVTVLETRPYVQQNHTGSAATLSGGGKKSIVVARIEQTEPGTSLVDIEKIRETLAANGLGIIGGADAIMNGTIHVNDTKASVNGIPRHTNMNDVQTTIINNTITTVQNEEVTVYKAENKLLFWLLIILGLLMLLAIAALIICCICPGCPFYMAPRKRRVHSSEVLVVRSDGRPKRHLHRQPAAAIEVSWNGRKQAWSADPTRRNWQFNKRNVKNCSLPGDVAYISGQPNDVHMNIEPQRLRDVPLYGFSRRDRLNEQERMYVEDVEGQKARGYDTAEMDSLHRHEMDRGSDLQRQAYRQRPDSRYIEADMNEETAVREQHFFHEGNAEVLRLVTRGQVEDTTTSHPHHHHPRQTTLVVDGKDIILQRFIEDQKSRHELSMQDIEAARSMESHQRAKEICQQQPPEIILLPDRLELGHRQHIEEIGPNVQRLVIDHGDYQSQKMEKESQMREILRQEKQEAAVIEASIAERPPVVTKEHHVQSNNAQYSFHDLELARQNALLTRLLLERENRRAGGGAGIDSTSYLETQSLPGQVAIATQTDRTTATQTERHVRSRSDNDESDEESKQRKKLKSRKKYGDGDWKRSRTLWMKSPIEEEGSPCFDKRLSILRKKVREVKEGRKVSLEPDVLREISDSLDGNGSSYKGEEDESTRTYRKSTEETSISYKVLNEKESGSQSSEETRKEKHRKTCEDVADDRKVNVTESTSSAEIEIQQEKHARDKTEEKSVRKEAKSKEQKKSNGMIKPSFRILEKEFTLLTKKLSKLGDKRFQESTGSDSTSQEKSESFSKDLKKDVDQKSSKKMDASSSHKQPAETTASASKGEQKAKLKKESAIAKTKQKLKYQQTQVMSTGSSEYDDTLDRPKKPTGVRQDGMKQKQPIGTQSHAKLKRQAQVDRREIRKQIAEVRDEDVEKRKDVSSKETSKTDLKLEKIGKMMTRAPKLSLLSRRQNITEETSTSSDEKKDGKGVSVLADSEKKSSVDFSERDSNGLHRREEETLRKNATQRFSDDFVEQSKRESSKSGTTSVDEEREAKGEKEKKPVGKSTADTVQLSKHQLEKAKDLFQKSSKVEECKTMEETSDDYANVDVAPAKEESPSEIRDIVRDEEIKKKVSSPEIEHKETVVPKKEEEMHTKLMNIESARQSEKPEAEKIASKIKEDVVQVAKEELEKRIEKDKLLDGTKQVETKTVEIKDHEQQDKKLDDTHKYTEEKPESLLKDFKEKVTLLEELEQVQPEHKFEQIVTEGKEISDSTIDKEIKHSVEDKSGTKQVVEMKIETPVGQSNDKMNLIRKIEEPIEKFASFEMPTDKKEIVKEDTVDESKTHTKDEEMHQADKQKEKQVEHADIQIVDHATKDTKEGEIKMTTNGSEKEKIDLDKTETLYREDTVAKVETNGQKKEKNGFSDKQEMSIKEQEDKVTIKSDDQIPEKAFLDKAKEIDNKEGSRVIESTNDDFKAVQEGHEIKKEATEDRKITEETSRDQKISGETAEDNEALEEITSYHKTVGATTEDNRITEETTEHRKIIKDSTEDHGTVEEQIIMHEKEETEKTSVEMEQIDGENVSLKTEGSTEEKVTIAAEIPIDDRRISKTEKVSSDQIEKTVESTITDSGNKDKINVSSDKEEIIAKKKVSVEEIAIDDGKIGWEENISPNGDKGKHLDEGKSTAESNIYEITKKEDSSIEDKGKLKQHDKKEETTTETKSTEDLQMNENEIIAETQKSGDHKISEKEGIEETQRIEDRIINEKEIIPVMQKSNDHKISEEEVIKEAQKIDDRKISEKDIISEIQKVGDHDISEKEITTKTEKVNDYSIGEKEIIKETQKVDDRKIDGKEIIPEIQEQSDHKINEKEVIKETQETDDRKIDGKEIISETQEHDDHKISEKEVIKETQETDDHKIKEKEIILETQEYDDHKISEEEIIKKPEEIDDRTIKETEIIPKTVDDQSGEEENLSKILTTEQQFVAKQEDILKVQGDDIHKEDDDSKIPHVEDSVIQEKDSSPKVSVSEKEDSQKTIDIPVEFSISSSEDIKQETAEASKSDEKIDKKDGLLSEMFKTVHSIADKLTNAKELVSTSIQKKTPDEKVIEKEPPPLSPDDESKKQPEMTDSSELFRLQTDDKPAKQKEPEKDDKTVEKRTETSEDKKLITDSRDTIEKDSQIDITVEPKLTKSEKTEEINESETSSPEEFIKKEEIDKSLKDEPTSPTKAVHEKTEDRQIVLLDSFEKALEASIVPEKVPDNETVDGKLARTTEKEKQLHEPPSKVSSSFQGTELLETSPQTSRTTEGEKFALDSIISETPTDSAKISGVEKQLKSESEQTELQKVEQFVEEETCTAEGDKIQSFPEEQTHTEPDISTNVSHGESDKQDSTEEKIAIAPPLKEDTQKEEKTDKPVDEQYADVSLPLFTNIVDTMDDSEDTDSSSDISRKTTLTTRPYQTPRHHARQSSEKETVQTMKRTETSEDEDKTTLTIEMMEDEGGESSKDEEMSEEIEDTSKEPHSSVKLIAAMKDEEGQLNEKDKISMDTETSSSHEKVIALISAKSMQDKQSESTYSSEVSDELPPITKLAKNGKLGSETKVTDQTANIKNESSKVARSETFKAPGKKLKEVEKKRTPFQKKKKSSSEESSEDKTTHSHDTASHNRYRARRKLPEGQSRQKDGDRTKQSRKMDEEPKQKHSTPQSRGEKDKKPSTSSEKHSAPSKTGEIDTIKAQPKYMAWYKKNREEMEKKRAELMATDDEEQLPRWLRRSMKNQKSEKEEKKTSGQKTTDTTPRTRRKVKPLVNVESEQLKAIVRQGRKLRRAEGGKNEDPPVQIFASIPPAPSQTDSKHHRVQHSEYKYEKVPAPFYLHPPPAPHPSPQLSPEHFEVQSTTECGHADEDFDSGITISLQGGNRLRHQQLLEKKSVFDIAYSEAAPSQLRSDSTTPPS
ncbi:Cad86C [Anthophora retusa]